MLTVNSYMQMSGSTLLIDIAGPNTGQFSVLDVLGNANINPNGFSFLCSRTVLFRQSVNPSLLWITQL